MPSGVEMSRADLAGLQLERLVLHLVVAGGAVADGLAQMAALRRQGAVGLHLGLVVELLLAVADGGVLPLGDVLLRLGPVDDLAVDLFAVVGLEAGLDVLFRDFHAVADQLAHQQLRPDHVLFPLIETLFILFQHLVGEVGLADAAHAGEVLGERRLDLGGRHLDALGPAGLFDENLVDEQRQPLGAEAGDEVFAELFARDDLVVVDEGDRPFGVIVGIRRRRHGRGRRGRERGGGGRRRRGRWPACACGRKRLPA